MERVARDKRSSLICSVISGEGRKSFMTFSPEGVVPEPGTQASSFCRHCGEEQQPKNELLKSSDFRSHDFDYKMPERWKTKIFLIFLFPKIITV